MIVRKIYEIKNWAAVVGGENGESEDEFLGESDSDDEYVCCESSYNNPQSEESITEKKEPDANCRVHEQNLHFCIKCKMFLCLIKNKNCYKTFHKS